MNDLPPPTAEGKLIRQARDLAIPRLSIRAAAARVGMSPEQWGNIERGYRYAKQNSGAPRRFSAPATTIAKMAAAVGVTAEQMETEGQRPDAAGVLAEMQRREAAAPRARPAPVRRGDVDFSGGHPDALHPWRQQVLRELYSALGLADRFGPGELPDPAELPGIEDARSVVPGSLVFSEEREARAWSDPALSVNEAVNVIAATRMLIAQADERENRRTGLGHHPVTGVIRAPFPVAGMAARASH